MQVQKYKIGICLNWKDDPLGIMQMSGVSPCKQRLVNKPEAFLKKK